MESTGVPAVLRERLGDDASFALLDVIQQATREGRDEVLHVAVDRFERRLTEEIGKVRIEMANLRGDLRQDMAQTGASLRQEMTEMGASLRQEMTQMGASLRQEMTQMGAGLQQEMTQMGAGLRQDMTQMGADLRQEIAATRVEIVRWSFLFWIGQLAAITGLLAFMR